MRFIVNRLRGDKTIWAVVFLLALISFLPVYSASTNLVYVIGKGSTIGYLIKHLAHLFIGFIIIFWIHKIPYHIFRALSIIGIPIIIALLIYTLTQGTTIGGANASRWIQIPFVGIGFQTSTLAFTVLMIYVARYLAKISDKVYTFKDSLLELWLPVFGVLIFVLPSNFSTTALMFAMVCMLLYVGQYPLKYLGIVLGSGVAMLLLFILLAKAFPDKGLFSRVTTWEKRVERFFDNKPTDDDYQIEKAKIAIASGKVYGLGPGKCTKKLFTTIFVRFYIRHHCRRIWLCRSSRNCVLILIIIRPICNWSTKSNYTIWKIIDNWTWISNRISSVNQYGGSGRIITGNWANFTAY